MICPEAQALLERAARAARASTGPNAQALAEEIERLLASYAAPAGQPDLRPASGSDEVFAAIDARLALLETRIDQALLRILPGTCLESKGPSYDY